MLNKKLTPIVILAALAISVSAVAGDLADSTDDLLWNYDDTFVEGGSKSTLSTGYIPIDDDAISYATFEVNENTVYMDYPGSEVIVEFDPRDTDDATVAHFDFLK